ncbi:MAG: THUMP domain-containing protein, partial [Candidatus Thermoplasmatota archaeon]
MKYIFELSKEHLTLPREEIKSALKAMNVKFEKIESNQDIFLMKTDKKIKRIQQLIQRIAFTYQINQYLFSLPIKNVDQIEKISKNKPIEEKGSIAVKYRNRSKNKHISKKIVKKIASEYTKNKTVSLEKPEIEIRALITDKKLYVGKKIADIDRKQYEKRKVQHRPFFLPISLHPKVARALVNLSQVKKNETLLDPFCGTGGILIEAGLIGIKVIGSDIKQKMTEGCKKNLEYYSIKRYDIFCCDIGDITKNVDKVDGIVTDLPYGKSTTT